MAKVEEWFPTFAVRLIERIPRPDWPVSGSEYWDTLKESFVRHGVQEAEADQATSLLAEEPPKYVSQFIHEILAKVRALWASNQVTPEAPNEREAAARLSADCDDCGGGVGLTVRFRKASRGGVDSQGRPLPDRVVFYCRCALGRWVERNHRTRSPEIRQRIHDLQDHPGLWGHEYRHAPGGTVLTPADAQPSEAPF